MNFRFIMRGFHPYWNQEVCNERRLRSVSGCFVSFQIAHFDYLRFRKADSRSYA